MSDTKSESRNNSKEADKVIQEESNTNDSVTNNKLQATNDVCGSDEPSEVEIETEEIEIDEDDIVAYLVDEDDNELGFIAKDENGEEKEYYYPEPIAPKKKKKTRREEDREAFVETAQTMKDFYSEGKGVVNDLRDYFLDIKKDLN